MKQAVLLCTKTISIKFVNRFKTKIYLKVVGRARE